MVKQRVGSPVSAASTALAPTATKTSGYTASLSDFVPVDTTSGAVTITLPTAPADKSQVGVKQIAGANGVVIACGGSDRFATSSSATRSLTVLGESAIMQYQASTALWFVTATDTPVPMLDARYPGAFNNVEGTQGFVYGHSYTTGTGSIGNFGWAQRLAVRTRIAGVSNQGNGGYEMADTAGRILRTWPVGTYGTVFVESVINDAVHAGSAQSITGFTNGVRAAIEFLRGGAKIEDTVPTYTGTWTAVTTDTVASGATLHSTTTQNDSFKINVFGPTCTLFFFGTDDAFTTPGGSVQVTVDGVNKGTFSLSNQMVKTASGQAKVHYPIILTGLGVGYHVITCTKTDATGSIVSFDCAVTPATFPPAIVLVKDGPTPGFSLASVNAYNSVLDTMPALYPANHVNVVPISSAWSSTACVSGSDLLHPCDLGHETLLTAVASVVQNLPYRAGIGTPSAADMAVTPPTPVSVADNFNRADNANSMGVTSTGSVPWQVDGAGMVWGISSNRAYCSVAPTSSGVSVETGKADCTITATLAVSSASNIGVRFRYADSGTGLVWFATAGVWTLTGGAVGSQIASPGNYTAGDTVQIVTSGTSITFKKNGSTLTTITSSVGQTNTRHGFQSNGDTSARWDDFSVA